MGTSSTTNRERGSWPVRRTFILVLDGVGIGSLPDAHRFGDDGANTLGHVLERHRHLRLPALCRLGLGEASGLSWLTGKRIAGAYARSAFLSPAKDTITGHWELCGVITERPFPTYPHGFPAEVIAAFTAAIDRPVLGNIAASGTEILQLLGETSRKSGQPIVYTSADSVFQLAAHGETVRLAGLYCWCRLARALLHGEHGVGRVIARPFSGPRGAFVRLPGRKDFTLPVPGISLLDVAHGQGCPVHALGKVYDLFSGRGIDQHWPAASSAEVMTALERLSTEVPRGIILATLGDFDTVYGHRNDPDGFAQALANFDTWLEAWLPRLEPEDLLVVTADHGCDPTWPTTDHTREWVPILLYGETVQPSRRVPDRRTLADVGATVAQAMGFSGPLAGESFWECVT